MRFFETIRRLLQGIGFHRRNPATPTQRLAMPIILPTIPEAFPMVRPTLAPVAMGQPIGRQVVAAVGAFQYNWPTPYGWFYTRDGANPALNITMHRVRLSDGAITTYGPFPWTGPHSAPVMTPNVRIYWRETYTAGRLLEYRLDTGTMTDLGTIFGVSGVSTQSIAHGVDNSVVVGSADQSMVHLRKADGTTQEYGPVHVDYNYIYTIGVDATHIYCALRGDDWRLVSVDRVTGAVVNLTAGIPDDGTGYIEIQTHFESGPHVRIRQNSVDTRYWLTAGAIGAVIPGALPSTIANDLADIVVDQASLSDTLAKVSYTSNRITTPMADLYTSTNHTPSDVFRIARYDATRAIIGTHEYGPAGIHDFALNTTTSLGAPGHTIYDVARAGNYVYATGYPSAATARKLLSSGFGWTSQGMPGADPGPMFGAHTGTHFMLGSDGRLYFIGIKSRFSSGFGLGWFDPVSGTRGVVDSGSNFVNLRVAWAAPMDGGQRMVITTSVDALGDPGAPVPSTARIIIFNVTTQSFVSYTPVAGQQKLGPISQVVGGALVGMYTNSVGQEGPTMVYRFDRALGELTAARLWTGLICGITDNSDVPLKAHEWMTGPDGNIWTVYRVPVAAAPAYIFTLNPVTLAPTPVGDVLDLGGEGIKLYFYGRDVYLTGYTQLRKLANLLPEVPPNPGAISSTGRQGASALTGTAAPLSTTGRQGAATLLGRSSPQTLEGRPT